MIHKAFPVHFKSGITVVMILAAKSGITTDKVIRFIKANPLTFSGDVFRVGYPLMSWHSWRRMLKWCGRHRQTDPTTQWLILGEIDDDA